MLWTNERDALVPMIYAVALHRTGDEVEAIRVLRESARRNPEGWTRRFALPGAGRIVHRPPALEASSSTADPERWSLLGLGRGLLQMGAPDAALAVYGEVLREDPGSGAAALGRGMSLFYLERTEEAAQAFQRAAELDPADAAPLYWLGSLQAAAGEPETAYHFWDDAFRLDPEHLRLRAALSDRPIKDDPGAKPADVQFLVEYLAMVGAEPARLVGVLEEAVPRAPDNFSMARTLAMNLRLCGRDREAAEAFVRAIETAERTEMPKGWVTAHYATLLAESADLDVRDPTAALQIAQKGIEAEDTPYGRVALGIALYRLDRFEEAITTLEGARTIKINRSLYLAMARLRTGDRQGAEKVLDAALKTISRYWKGRPLPDRVATLQAEACGLLGRSVPNHR